MDQRKHNPRQAAFSLIELTVALAVFGICLALTGPALSEATGRVKARSSAQVWQSAGSWAQLRQLWSGGTVAVEGDARGIRVDGPTGSSEYVPAICAERPQANVARWRMPGGIEVSFGGLLASPDGAGSLTFGVGTQAARVVVRAESGLTQRTAQ